VQGYYDEFAQKAQYPRQIVYSIVINSGYKVDIAFQNCNS